METKRGNTETEEEDHRHGQQWEGLCWHGAGCRAGQKLQVENPEIAV